jgi:hypothetical protein
MMLFPPVFFLFLNILNHGVPCLSLRISLLANWDNTGNVIFSKYLIDVLPQTTQILGHYHRQRRALWPGYVTGADWL